MKTIISTICISLILLAAVILSYLSVQKYLKNEAVTECLHIDAVTTQNGGQKITAPENYWYTFCMKEKGYK